MDDKQKLIVQLAREWLGVKYVHQGRSKEHGCDCIAPAISVGKKLGMEISDITNYSRLPQGTLLKDKFESHCIRISKADIQPGDIVLILTKQFNHVGIIGDYHQGGLSLIHSYSSVGKVVEHFLDEKWMNRISRAYRVP